MFVDKKLVTDCTVKRSVFEYNSNSWKIQKKKTKNEVCKF